MADIRERPEFERLSEIEPDTEHGMHVAASMPMAALNCWRVLAAELEGEATRNAADAAYGLLRTYDMTEAAYSLREAADMLDDINAQVKAVKQ